MCAKSTRCLSACRGGQASISADEQEDLESEKEIRVKLWTEKKLLVPPAEHLPVRYNFERLMKLLMWYTGVTVPLMAAFQIPYDPVQLIIDYIVDVVFWVDILLTMRTTYYDQNNDLVTNPKLIRDAYLFGRFPFDVIANIPWELLALAAGHATDSTTFSTWKLIRMFRFCRIKKIHKPVLVDVHDSGARQLVLYFPLMTHWTACTWWAIGWSELKKGNVGQADWIGGSAWLSRTPDSPATNTASERLGESSSLAQDYVSSIYWSSTTLMKAAWVGPSTVSEKCFAGFVVLLGAVMFAVILGQINGIIRKMDESTVQRRTKLATFKQFCAQNNIGPVLTKKVINYANAEWNVTGGVSAAGAFEASKLSVLLKSSMIYEMHKDLLRSSALLTRCSMGCAKQILTKASTQVCLKNENLVGYGQMAREAFMLLKGSLQLSIPDNVRKKSTMPGDNNSRKSMSKKPNMSFRIIDRTGAITGMWKPQDNSCPYPYEIVAKEFCTMLNISRAAMLDIFGNISSIDRNEINEYLNDEHEVTMQALKVGGKRTTSVRASKASSRNSLEDVVEPPEEDVPSDGKPTLKDAKEKLETLANTVSAFTLSIGTIRKTTEDLRDIWETVSGETTDRSGGDTSRERGRQETAAEQRQKDREEQLMKKRDVDSNDEKQQITKASSSGADASLTAAMVL